MGCFFRKEMDEMGENLGLSMEYLQCCINNLLNNFMVLSPVGLALRIRTRGFSRTLQL